LHFPEHKLLLPHEADVLSAPCKPRGIICPNASSPVTLPSSSSPGWNCTPQGAPASAQATAYTRRNSASDSCKGFPVEDDAPIVGEVSLVQQIGGA
jgi:hypothetical protein